MPNNMVIYPGMILQLHIPLTGMIFNLELGSLLLWPALV